MLSIKPGHDVEYLTKAVAGGREGYYTGAVDAGEPPGRWFGAGAERLGLAGEVDADLMDAVYTHLLDPRDPATLSRSTWGEAAPLAAGHRAYKTPEQIYAGLLEASPGATPEHRRELRAQAERSARQAVSFIDVTFSAPKSVTVLGAAFERAANDAAAAGDQESAEAWRQHAKAVEDAMLAGSRAALAFLQEHAGYSRLGHHGGASGRWIDAHDFVAALFLQHDSRDRDPHWHVHAAILNRVLCSDGVWRALDGRAIHNLRGAASAIAERVMEAHLTKSLGVRFETRPDGMAREVVGVPQAVIDLFSSRRRAITGRTRELVDAYTARHGHEPNALQRSRLAMRATLATRAAKSHHGETREEQLDRWDRELRAEVGSSLGDVARGMLALRQQADPEAEWSVQDVVERALDRVARNGAHWSRSDLLRAVSDELPGHLGIGPEQIEEFLTGLTDTALAQAVRHAEETDTSAWPDELRLANGRSVYERPESARFSTPGQLRAEALLAAAAVERGAPTVTVEHADEVLARFAAAGRPLGVDQAAAVRGVLTSGAQVEVIAAAAGTGKSFTVGVLADMWATGGRRVVGLAPSEVAAEVLRDEGLSAANTTAWLGAQRRLAAVRPGAPDGFGDERWRLHAGDLVVVDEAGMTTTDDLAAILDLCARVGAKLLLVGDPRQLAAVGPGGALADLATRGIRYELTEVRRFVHGWEGPASLRLREGDASVLADYAKHGRLVDGGTAEQAEAAAARAWLADTLAGRESLLLVGTNEAAARASAALRAQLVELGHVQEHGVRLGRPGWKDVAVGVGDLVQARRNAHELVGFAGNRVMPVNRCTYRVTELRPDGGLTVVPQRGPDVPGLDPTPIALPADYVAEHVTLGYASTVHSAQGRTVDTAHAVAGSGFDLAALYVALTRGRDRNTAWAVTRAVAPDAETGQTFEVHERTARAVLHDILDAAHDDRSATTERERARLDAASTMTHVDQLVDGVGQVTAGRTAAMLDRLAAEGHLTAEHRAALVTDEAAGSLERLLRLVELSGHDRDKVLADAVTARSLDGATYPAQVLHSRITTALRGRLTPQITSAHDLIPPDLPPAWDGWLRGHADAADQRRAELGAQLAEQPPDWAVAALGPVPERTADPSAERAEWEQKVGWAAAWRELDGQTEEPTDQYMPLGPAPAAGLAEKRALFRTAHEALGLVDAGDEEANMTNGRLRSRVHAYEREKVWAPRDVADELGAAHQRAQEVRADATLWAARADATIDPDEQGRLRDAAQAAQEEADALAEQIAVLEEADEARAVWFTHTATTRDHADRGRSELRSRGVDVDHPTDRVTAEEWLDAHRIEQLAADADREIRDEHELLDLDLDADLDDVRAELDAHAASQPETDLDDVRGTETMHPSEDTDAPRNRTLAVDQTTADVARAQLALAEIATRRQADAAREAEEAALRETRVAGHTEEDVDESGYDLDDELVDRY